MKAQLQNKKILCRICKGDHFTTKCPYKDSLGMEDAASAAAPAEDAGKDPCHFFCFLNKGQDQRLNSSKQNPSFVRLTPFILFLSVMHNIAPAAEQQTGSKYIAPHMRAGASSDVKAGNGGPGSSDREKRDEQPTLRVTNLSEDATEADVSELFKRFGHISRVFLARDRETGFCKGFAFVSFTMREDAQRAQEAIDGRGYDNLILRVEWAK